MASKPKVESVTVIKGDEWFRMEQVSVDEVIIRKRSGSNPKVCSFPRSVKGASRLLRKLIWHDDFRVTYGGVS
jgi:hypothetical protein